MPSGRTQRCAPAQAASGCSAVLAIARASPRTAARSPRSTAARSGRARASAARSRSAPCRAVVSAIVSSTAGCSRAACAEPSREPLSSTSTSVANGNAARSRAIASRPRSSRSRWEVLTTQYVSSISSPCESARAARRRHQRHCLRARLLSGPCAFTSSIPRPTRRPMTMPCAARWGRPAPRSSSSRAASPTGRSPPPRGTRGASCFYRRASACPARVARAGEARRARPRHAALPPVAREADVVHFQWLAVQHLDGRLLLAGRRARPRRCSPRTTSCRANPDRDNSRPSDGCTSASTRSSSTPPTAARG